MKERGNFQSLPIFDLVAMTALLFMAILWLRGAETRDVTMPVIKSVASEDSAEFANLRFQIKELEHRMLRNKETNKYFVDFSTYEPKLETIFANPNYREAIRDSTLDIFSRVDTVLHTRKKSGEIIRFMVATRDTLLHKYFRDTKIEIKEYREDMIEFPLNSAVPYPQSRVSRKPLPALLGEIYDTVDVRISQGYNNIAVIGHTDTLGTAIHNRELSRQRAMYLANLIQSFVDRKYSSNLDCIVEAKGYGEFEIIPANGESPEDFLQKNRRVEIRFSKEIFPYYHFRKQHQR
jgi:outer membrane protein OmpA-like peptidoglycan-associated protein